MRVRYAVIMAEKAPETLPSAPVTWNFMRWKDGLEYVGLEYGQEDEAPDLDGWILFAAADELAEWMGEPPKPEVTGKYIK